jgi:hypothetical protein
MPRRKPPLTVAQILAWADSHLARTGQWPGCEGGHVLDNKNEKWQNIDKGLARGYRGLPGGDSLARLLDREHGRRNTGDLPELTEGQVLGWAQAHRARTGGWPHLDSGPVGGTHGETWANVNLALRQGRRGFPGGDSLARLLARRLGVRNLASVPRLTRGLILRWADAHQRRHSDWPRARGGPVEAAPGDTWTAVDDALRYGRRGLPGGPSLAQLLAQRRGARNRGRPPRLRARQVLAWADAHHARTGRWPNHASGPAAGAPGETWRAVHLALVQALRGFPGGDTLARLPGRSGRNVPGRRGRPKKAPGPPADLAASPRPAVPSARSRAPAVGARGPQAAGGLRPFLLAGRERKAPARASHLPPQAPHIAGAPPRGRTPVRVDWRASNTTRGVAPQSSLPPRRAGASITLCKRAGLDRRLPARHAGRRRSGGRTRLLGGPPPRLSTPDGPAALPLGAFANG